MQRILTVATLTIVVALSAPLWAREEPAAQADPQAASGDTTKLNGDTSLHRKRGRDRTPCVLPEEDVEIRQTSEGIAFVRTPDSCFANLPGYRF